MSCRIKFSEHFFFLKNLIIEVKRFSFSFCLLRLSAEDVKRLNEKLTETNKIKTELQLKLDDLLSSEVTIKVHTRLPESTTDQY